MIHEGDCGVIGGAKDDCRGNRRTRRKPAPAPLCPTTNSIWPGPVSNPGPQRWKRYSTLPFLSWRSSIFSTKNSPSSFAEVVMDFFPSSYSYLQDNQNLNPQTTIWIWPLHHNHSLPRPWRHQRNMGVMGVLWLGHSNAIRYIAKGVLWLVLTVLTI
jgi:hypothetical protein